MPDLWGESPFLISCCQILTESYSRPRTKVGFFFRKKETTMVEKTTIVSTTKSLVVGRFALRCPKFQFRTKPIGFSSRIFYRSGNAGIRTRDTMIFSFTLANPKIQPNMCSPTELRSPKDIALHLCYELRSQSSGNSIMCFQKI